MESERKLRSRCDCVACGQLSSTIDRTDLDIVRSSHATVMAPRSGLDQGSMVSLTPRVRRNLNDLEIRKEIWSAQLANIAYKHAEG